MGVRGTTFKYVALAGVVLLVAGIAAAAWRTGALPIREWFRARSSPESGAPGDQVVVGKLVGPKQNILELSPDVSKFIGVQTADGPTLWLTCPRVLRTPLHFA